MNVWLDYDQAALDAQYRTRDQIGDGYLAWNRNRSTSSAETRRLLGPRLDVAYGPGTRQKLDLFPAPEGALLAPIAVFVHGGFWRAGDKSEFSVVARGLRSLGAVIAVISYPLCPAARLNEVVSGVRDAVSWLVAHANEFGGDPETLWAFGHSSGAHLAAMCFCGNGRDGETPPGTIKGALLTSGMYDLEAIRRSELNAVANLSAEQVENFSPARLPVAASGPLLVAVGSEETAEYQRQAREFVDALVNKGAQATLAIVPSTNHYSMLDQWVAPDSILLTHFRSLLGISPPVGVHDNVRLT